MAAVLVGGLGACAGGGPPKVVASGAAEDVRPAAERRCAHWIVGASAAAAEQRLIVLGGGYGTVEVPRFVADLTCQLGAKGPVVLALQWPRRLASQLNLFISGSETASERLRADVLWTEAAARQDGRAAQSMWQLFEQLRALKAAGLELWVVPYGANSADDDESSERWYQQSEVAEAMRRRADSTFLLWTSEAEGEYTAGESDTLTARLHERDDGKLRSFKLEWVNNPPPVETPAGAASAPSASAPVAPVAATAVAPWSLELRRDVARYDGVFRVGLTTISPDLQAAAAAP